MPWVAAVGAIASQVGGSIVGGIEAGNKRDAAQAAMEAAYKEIESVGAPPDLSREIVLKHFQRAGVLTPEVENSIDAGFSKVAQIQEDPSTRDASVNALRMLQQRGQLGLSPEDRAAFNKIRNQVASETEGKRQQILQSFAARGQGGSGAELATQMAAAQQGTQQASEEGDRMAATSSARALQAMSEAGKLGSQIRGQDFDVANTKAQAEDAIRRFNTQNAIGMQQRNVDRRQMVQGANLGEQQRVMDANTMMDNNERMRQEMARRQYWQDKLEYGKAKATSYKEQAGYNNAQADRTAGNWQKVGSGIAAGIGSAYKWGQQQPANAGGSSAAQSSQYGPNYDRLDLMGEGDEMEASTHQDPWRIA